MGSFYDKFEEKGMSRVKELEHQHKYVIPVEWKYLDEVNTRDEYTPYKRKQVTKLRCECGEEIAR